MKNLTHLIVLCLACTLQNAYGQISKEKKYNYLRNYVAPDFKQKRFDITFNGFGGKHAKFTDEATNLRLNSTFGYSQFSNSQSYQGSLTATLYSRIRFAKTESNKNANVSNIMVLNSNNRFYVGEKSWFLGLKGFNSFGLINMANDSTSSNTLLFNITPAFSMGFGRLEPIQYARNAMDIEKSLKKGNRLKGDYTFHELNVIADQLAVINNERFYDFRLRRIEQFEAIDRALKDIGHLSEFDISYFSYLSDAYLYAQNFPRSSGFIHEFGMAGNYNLNYHYSNDSRSERYGAAVFYDFSYHIPISYAIQNSIKVTVLGGPNATKINGQTGFFDANAFVVAGYEFGLFPTTRTNFNFGLNIGVDLANQDILREVYANGAVYLSPQFRLSFALSYVPADVYLFNSYTSIFPTFVSYSDYRLNATIGLNYAIF